MVPPAHGKDSSLQRLINRARNAAQLSPREKLLHQWASSQAGKAPSMNTPSSTPDEPPEEFVAVLRKPSGQQHRLAVTIDGQEILLVLNSRGDTDTARESFLWRWLLHRVRQESAL